MMHACSFTASGSSLSFPFPFLPSFLAAVQINFAKLRAFPLPPLPPLINLIILRRLHRFREGAAALH